jgi:hypothetical protein
MGWWERSSNRWRMAIVAQLGGGYVVGAGGFFIQFTAPELGRRKPLFLALAAGPAVGGSIGSAVGIPWSEVVRRLINPDAVPTPRDDLIFSPLDGSFALRDIQGAQFSITQTRSRRLAPPLRLSGPRSSQSNAGSGGSSASAASGPIS